MEVIMRTKSLRSLRWVLAPILLASALSAVGGPALADGGSGESGAASGVGTEDLSVFDNGLPTCLQVQGNSSYTINSPVAGRITANGNVYSGPVKIVLDPKEPYYINPAGAFADPGCTDPDIEATITVSSPGSTRVSACGSTTAIYNRAGSAVSYHGHGDCKVDNVSAGLNTSHRFVGDLAPCLPVPGDDPVTCGAAQLQGSYSES